MKNGFYCRMYGKDCFLVSPKKNRTKALAEEFINKVQNKMNKFYNISGKDVEYVQNAMRNATFEIKTIENGNFARLSYYEIIGDNFSYGCDACENPMDYCCIV